MNQTIEVTLELMRREIAVLRSALKSAMGDAKNIMQTVVKRRKFKGKRFGCYYLLELECGHEVRRAGGLHNGAFSKRVRCDKCGEQ